MTDSDYDVGYKKPPKAGQFQPGKSGNPRGRSKNIKNFRTDFMEELDQKIELSEGGKKVKVSKQQALIKRLINGAINGDAKATATVVPLILDFSDVDDIKNNAKPLTDQESLLLRNYLQTGEGYNEK
jgi:hypothetical protein